MVTAGDIGQLGLGVADRIDYVAPAAVVSSMPEARTTASPNRLLSFSEPTATYDARGNFPSLRVFQIAKPQPDYRPYGDLVEDLPVRGAGVLLGAYSGRQKTSSTLVDHLV